MTVINQTIKSLVFEKIRQRELRPTELVRELLTEAYPREIENALSALLDEGSVKFDSDRHLRTTGTAAHEL
jgi:hypothetical protein